MRNGFLKIKPATGFFLISCLLAGCTTYNPATGRREFIAISTESEVAMGRNVHQQISQEFKFSQSAEQFERLKRIAQRLVSVSDRQDYKYNFYLIEKDELNAFTTPGGNIYFFQGLFDKLQTDDEIAAVLAHEIGHSAARHTVKKFQAAMGYNLLAALVLSQTEMESSARTAVTAASNTAMQLAMSAYSRQDEYEADRLGIKYMFLAGYDLNGMIKTLEILQKETKGDRIPLILRTHPYVADRITVAKEEIEIAPDKYRHP